MVVFTVLSQDVVVTWRLGNKLGAGVGVRIVAKSMK